MNISKTLLSIGVACLYTFNATAATVIYEETFDTSDSISSWGGNPSWNGTIGKTGGAVVVSNNVQPTNKNYTIQIPLELTEETDLVVSFDAKSLVNVAGVFHFYAEPEALPQYFLKFNIEAEINANTYTTFTFPVNKVPATATFITLRFEMITGAVQGADVSVAIDNLKLSGPDIDPEGTWKGFTLVGDFWAQNVGRFNWLYVEFDPWVYSSDVDAWLYLPEESSRSESGAWFFMPEFP